jgi:hypothetical protein
VSIYSDLLRYALADEGGDARFRPSVDELVARLSERRARIGGTPSSRGVPSSSPERMAEFVAHDVVLVRLCERLCIDQMLTDPWASPRERDRLVSLLAEQGFDLGEIGPRGS